jgi:HlyD family secretion protein
LGALFRQGADWATYVVESGTARLRVLQLGARNGEYAEVEAGLAEGEQVILHPSDKVADGSAVEVPAAD